jgi:hypothetical protein
MGVTFWFVENPQPWFASVRVRVKVEPDAATCALMLSPGATGYEEVERKMGG